MSSHYTVLGIEPTANTEEIAVAYARQRERYDPERVRELDPELRRVAEQRTAAIERAHQVLSDQERRRQYDASIGAAPGGQAATLAAKRRTITPRERSFALIGIVAAIGIVATIWLLTGRDAAQGVAMGEIDRPAPPIELPSLDGGAVSLAAYRGEVVLVNFWGTWCEPCQREMPALQAAHEQLGPQGLRVIGVDLADDERTQGKTEDDIRAFIAQYQVTYPIALDYEGEVTNAYRVFPLPTSFFIDAEGQIRYVHVGELTYEDVVARFDELRQTISASR